jgi:D-xylose transport system permease protein
MTIEKKHSLTEPAKTSVVAEGWARATASMRRENGGYSPIPGLIALVIVFFVFAIPQPTMFGSFTIQGILLSMTSYGLVALGVVLVLTIGEIDLSVGSIAGLGSAITGTLLQVAQVNWIIAIACGVLAGAAAGFVQGMLVTRLGVPSFIITLGGLLSWQGVQLAILHDTTLNVTSSALDVIGSGTVTQAVSLILAAVIVILCAIVRLTPLTREKAALDVWFRRIASLAGIAVVAFGGVFLLSSGSGVPIVIWVYAGIIAVVGFVLQRTRTGRAVYAVGGNAEAARRAGFRPNVVKVAVFSLSGGFAALGGVYIVARGGTADTLTGSGSLVLIAIAAAVIGGCSLFGGRSSPWAAFIGAAVLATLVQGLNIANQGADLQLVLEGAILVAAVAVDAILRRRIARRGPTRTAAARLPAWARRSRPDGRAPADS